MSNVLADAIKNPDNKTMYNDCCKAILSCKQILSRILQQTTDEYKNVQLETIQEYIEGVPEISSIPVLGDSYENEMIVGSDTVNTKPREGTLTYDIKFAAYTPDKKNRIKMYVNIEAQKKFNPGYSLTTRGIYYGTRMISSQYGVEFHSSEYDNIKKVYSIWICMEAPKYIGNAITKYAITKEDLIGFSPDKKMEYDKMVIIFVYLNQKTDDTCKLTNLLNTIFTNELNYDEKITILKDKHKIILEDKTKEDLNQMCNLAEGLEEKITRDVTERVTASVTASVIADDIKKAANMLRKKCANEDEMLELICEEYDMSADDVKNILYA